MTNQLTDAVRSLLRTKEKAETRLEEIDKERREIKASLKSLDSALRALGHEQGSQSRSKAATTAEIGVLKLALPEPSVVTVTKPI